jgi:prepilin-type N-terminal cleavage/methylation domain-containing protein
MIKKYSAFTLIELLFVIAIIGVMASIGISYMSKRAEDAKIKKTVLQIQQLLEAGVNYYVAQESWPSSGSTSQIKCPADAEEAFCPYIPDLEVMLENPWGGKDGYKWESTGKRGNFKVSTTVPQKNIATRVAAILPNAITKDSILTAAVAAPRGTIATPPPRMIIVRYGTMQKPISYSGKDQGLLHCKYKDLHCYEGIQYVPSLNDWYPDKDPDMDNAASIDYFPCPKGMVGDVVLWLKKLDKNTSHLYLNVKKVVPCEDVTRYVTPYKPTHSTFLCSLFYHVEVGKHASVSATYNYMSICRDLKF